MDDRFVLLATFRSSGYQMLCYPLAITYKRPEAEVEMSRLEGVYKNAVKQGEMSELPELSIIHEGEFPHGATVPHGLLG